MVYSIILQTSSRLQEFETAGKVIESVPTIPFMEYGLILQRTTDRLTLRTEIILESVR